MLVQLLLLLKHYLLETKQICGDGKNVIDILWIAVAS